MKQILLVCLFVSIFSPKVFSQPPENGGKKFYAGINPVSYIAVLPLQDDLKRYIPIVSGLEYGVSLIGGYHFSPRFCTEIRFAWGDLHQISTLTQIHAGIMAFPFYGTGKNFGGTCAGIFLKWADYYNHLTQIHFDHIIPYISAGYRFYLSPLYLDLRLNQTFAILSWSDLPYTSSSTAWFFSPWPEFIPVLPTLYLSVSYCF